MKSRKNNGLIQLDSTKKLVTAIAMLNILLLIPQISIVGVGYLGLTVVFFMVLSLSVSDWLAEYTAKYMKLKILRSQYVNAGHFWKTALLVQFLCNLVVCAVLFLLGDYITNFLFYNLNLSLCLKVILPILLLAGITKMIHGYLIGLGMFRPVKTILIIQQISMLILSVIGEMLFRNYGKQIASLLRNDEIIYIYQVFGILLGGGIAIVIGCILSLIFFLILRSEYVKLQMKDSIKKHEKFLTEIKAIIVALPTYVLIKTAPLWAILIDFMIYVRVYKTTSETLSIMTLAGMLFGVVIPIIILLLQGWEKLILPFEKHIKRSLKNQDIRLAKEYMHGIMRGCVAEMLPISVLLLIIAEPLLKIVGITEPDAPSMQIFHFGMGMIFMMSVVFFMNKIIEIFGKNKSMAVFMLISLVLQSIACLVAATYGDLDVYSIYVGIYSFAIFDFVLLLVLLKKKIHIALIYIRDIIINAVLIFFAGFVVYLLYQYICSGWEILAAIFVCTVLYFIIYLILMSILPILEQNDRGMMPGGTFFYYFKNFFHPDERGKV